jgi:hypothetical protein
VFELLEGSTTPPEEGKMADFAAIKASPSFNETVKALIGESTTPISTALNVYFVLAEGALLSKTAKGSRI